MHFKLLIVFVDDSKTDAVMEAARASGATGCTVINHARGEGHAKQKSFLGLTLTVDELQHAGLAERTILEEISKAGELDDKPGAGIAIQIDVEDAVGVLHQAELLTEVVEDQL